MTVEGISNDGIALVSIDQCCLSMGMERKVLWDRLDERDIRIEYLVDGSQKVPAIRIDDFVSLSREPSNDVPSPFSVSDASEPARGPIQGTETSSAVPDLGLDTLTKAKSSCSQTLKLLQDLETQYHRRTHEVRELYQAPLRRQDEKIEELLREQGRRDQEIQAARSALTLAETNHQRVLREHAHSIEALQRQVDEARAEVALTKEKLSMAETVEHSLQKYTSKLEEKLRALEKRRK